MLPLTLAAHITVKTGKIDLVKAELEKLVDPTRAEDGCLQYDLHQDNKNPAHFMFVENWTTYDAWQAHMTTPHIKAYMAAVDGAVEDFTVYEMTKQK